MCFPPLPSFCATNKAVHSSFSVSLGQGGRGRERERKESLARKRLYTSAQRLHTTSCTKMGFSIPPPLPVLSVGPRPNKMGGKLGEGGGRKRKSNFSDRRSEEVAFRPHFFVFGEWIDGLAGRWMTEDIKTPSSSSPPMLPPTQ